MERLSLRIFPPHQGYSIYHPSAFVGQFKHTFPLVEWNPLWDHPNHRDQKFPSRTCCTCFMSHVFVVTKSRVSEPLFLVLSNTPVSNLSLHCTVGIEGPNDTGEGTCELLYRLYNSKKPALFLWLHAISRSAMTLHKSGWSKDWKGCRESPGEVRSK